MSVRIAVRREDDFELGVIGEAAPGETIQCLEEYMRYFIMVLPDRSGPSDAGFQLRTTKLFIDDIEVTDRRGNEYRWCADFFAGTVGAIVVDVLGTEWEFFLDVEPARRKSGPEQFKEMLAHIRAFDATLLTGSSAATVRFGHEQRGAKLALLAQLARLQQYGPGFLAAVAAVTSSPHQALQASTQNLRLSQVRRLHPGALRDRRLAALAVGQVVQHEDLENLEILSNTASVTSDTPANQTLGALLIRFRATAFALLTDLMDRGLGEPVPEERARRQPRRKEFLERLVSQAEQLLRSYPFRHMLRVRTTSAGLTQISAKPTYSRAYRRGIQALRTGVEGGPGDDALRIPPTWGVYETWCYVEVVRQLVEVTGVPFVTADSATAAADLVQQGLLADGTKVEVLFQATFRAVDVARSRLAHTLSGERRPDIVIVAERNGQRRYLVFDAKWKSARERVLQAMESAHVYHDALRLDSGPEGQRPDFCLLLIPGSPVIPALEHKGFWRLHGVGVQSDFLPGSGGTERLHGTIASWLSA